ncbi:MAG: triose-phosphate isomerase [Candidatus Saganbacteria bacterium]|nr:triose-phosphate isomerase [Candidatus Saganbacteria bacterium]
MRKPLIAGNWKMFKTAKEAASMIEELKTKVSDVKDREIAVCPTFTALESAVKAAKGSNVNIGGQNVFWEEKGAFTGEIAPNMLKDIGCKFVIIGHSERRQYFRETDETVNKRIFAALKAGLLPIVCVGETLGQREESKTFSVVETQVRNGLKGLIVEQMKNIVIAYEPVWAIGTGKTATPAQAQEVHAFIRKLLKDIFGPEISASTRVLYGGSVKPDNMKELMSCEDIDGGLVGGASLEAESFSKIIKY